MNEDTQVAGIIVQEADGDEIAGIIVDDADDDAVALGHGEIQPCL